jgi:hypothetical protein
MTRNKEEEQTGRKLLDDIFQSMKPTQRTLMLLLVLVVVLAIFGILAYFCWYLWLISIWQDWALVEMVTGWKAFKIFVAGFTSIYLILIPFIPFYLAREAMPSALRSYLSDRTQKRIDDINEEQEKVEDELLRKDDTGLIQLIRYSRLQLNAYYTVGMNQTKKSFRYSVLAMWIGFAVIIAGVGIFIFPSGTNPQTMAKDNIHFLTIASGSIIEIVSALFLWVYSRTMRQLTYFYNRQSYNHTLAMCSRIAGSMETTADETKRLIVEKAMEYSWSIPEDTLPGVGRLGLFKNRKGNKS